MIHTSIKRDQNWDFDFQKFSLYDLKITNDPLGNDDYIGCTYLSNYLVVIKNSWIFYVDLKDFKLVFNTNLKSTEAWDEIIEFESISTIESSDDLVGLTKKNRKIVYLSLINEIKNSEFKLKLFTSKLKKAKITCIKVRKNMLLVFKKTGCHLKIYDLNKVKIEEKFSEKSKIFDKSILDRDLLFDLSSDLKYLIAFQKPRNLYVYRLSDLSLIAQVPIKIKLKQFVSSGMFLTCLLDNNEILSFMIADQKSNNVQERLKSLDFRFFSKLLNCDRFKCK